MSQFRGTVVYDYETCKCETGTWGPGNFDVYKRATGEVRFRVDASNCLVESSMTREEAIMLATSILLAAASSNIKAEELVRSQHVSQD